MTSNSVVPLRRDRDHTLSWFPDKMGKLNIAHHKSYHPYRLDNIERVRKDEEEARLKEQGEEGRMRVAVSDKNVAAHLHDN